MNPIRAKRLALGISATELARRTGHRLPALSKIEHGKQRLRADQVRIFARALGCQVEELIPLDDTEDTPHELVSP